MHYLKHFIFSLLILTLADYSFAESNSSDIGGVAKVNSTCTVIANNLIFGNVVSANTGRANNISTVTATCTKDTAFNITFDNGHGTIANRYMMGNVSLDSLFYNIYKDISFSQVLGDGNNGTFTISDIGNGLDQSYTIYGSLFLNQYATPDNYSDNLTLLLTY